MKIVLSSRGSRGDVNPIIEIAAIFKQMGNDVSLCVPGVFKDYSIKLGLDPFTYKDEDSKALMKDIGSGLGSLKSSLAFFANSIDEQFDFMLNATKDADVLVTTINEVVAPTVAEYRNIPHFRIGFAPVLPGNHPPPFMPWQNMSPAFNRLGWKGLNMLSKIIINKFINKKRVELGLQKAKDANQYHTGNSHTFLAIDPVLSPPCKSWENRYNYNFTGYCYGQIDGELDPALLEFIENGDPPVYIGFGSVYIKNSERFTKIVIEAVEKTGCRVVLGQGWTGLGNRQINKNIFSVGDLHHGTLFPKMAGIVHHGGSGTTHTAARAGIPQFILPQIIDQYYWGNQIFKMDIGPKSISPNKITTERLASVLVDFTRGKHKNQARHLAQSMQHQDGVQEIVNLVNKIVIKEKD